MRLQQGNSCVGVTLVELVLAIVIISVAFTGLMMGYSSIVTHSSDPLVYQQAIAIADSFMDEITSKQFPTGFSGTCPSATVPRSQFDNVCDYAGYSSSVITDLAGNDIGLKGYSLAVSVVAGGSDLGLAPNDALKITVEVTNPLGNTLPVVAYRTNY